MTNHSRFYLSPHRLAQSLWFRLRPIHALLGWLIEVRGNVIRIGDSKILLGSGLIPRHRKIFLLSGYERPELCLITRHLHPDLPVVELGGFIGGVSCTINKLLAEPNNHCVVEANSKALAILEENRTLNSCNFKIMHRAIAYGNDRVAVIDAGMSSTIKEMPTHPEEMVETITLREILAYNQIEITTLICDIEGHEYLLIENEQDVISAYVAYLFIEVHDDARMAMTAKNLLSRLSMMGFVVLDQVENVYYLENAQLTSPIREE